jgi:general secretion pathway protein J
MPGIRCVRGQSGFTLLEVLVALTVLGLLVAGLSQGVRTSLALRQAQASRFDKSAELDTTQRALRLLLGHLSHGPDVNRPAGESASLGFRGEADRVSFFGDLPTGLGGTRHAAMTLDIERGRLVLLWSPYHHEKMFGPTPAPQRTELLRGAERLDLAYRAPPGGQPQGWQSQWEGPEPPGLIRVRIGFGAADRRRWPELIVAPRP